jgi:hypothetical protein
MFGFEGLGSVLAHGVKTITALKEISIALQKKPSSAYPTFRRTSATAGEEYGTIHNSHIRLKHKHKQPGYDRTSKKKF